MARGWSRIVAIALLASACTSGGTSSISPHPTATSVDGLLPSPAGTTPVGHADLGALPILAAVADKDRILWTLSKMLIPRVAACMQAKGINYRETLAEEPSVPDAGALLRNRYASPKLFADGSFGYFHDDRSHVDPPTSQGDQSAAAGRALFGDEVAARSVVDANGNTIGRNRVGNGCLGSAQVQIFGDPNAVLDFYTSLNWLESALSQSLQRLQASQPFAASMATWSKCMASAGYTFADIFGPSRSDWPDPRPSPVEQQVAHADAACRNAAGLSDTDLAQMETPIQTALLEHNQGVIENLRQSEQKVNAAAKSTP